MSKITQWLKNRKYSSRMIFFLTLSILSMYIIHDRYNIEGSVTETILTPPQYEAYQRLMIIPIILMALVPVQLGMWFKEEQLKRSGLLIPKGFNIRVKDLTASSDYQLSGKNNNVKSDKEEEYDFEYTI